jgi:hypothetical protein
MRISTLIAFFGAFVLAASLDVRAAVISQSRVSSVEVLGQATDSAGSADYHQGPQTFSGTGPSSLNLAGGIQSPQHEVTASSSASESSSVLDHGNPFGAIAHGFTSATLVPVNSTGEFIPGILAVGRSSFNYTFHIEGSPQPFTLTGFLAHTNDGIAIVSLKDVALAPDNSIAFASLTGDDVGLKINLAPTTGVFVPGHDYVLSLFSDSTANRDSTAEYDVHLAFIPEVSALAPLGLVLLAAAVVQRRTRKLPEAR